MPIRILHLLDHLAPEGPAGMAARLCSFGASGIEYHMARLSRQRTEIAEPCPQSMLHAPLRGAADVAGAVRLARVIREMSPHIVHAWQPLGGMVGLFAAAAAGVPRRVASARTRTHARRLAEFGGMAPFTQVVCPSRSLAKYCIQLGIPKALIACLPDGADPLPAAAGNQVFSHSLDLPSDVPAFVSISSLSASGRIFDLVWACDVLQVVRDRFELWVQGTTGSVEQLLRFAHLVEMLPRTKVLGGDACKDELFRTGRAFAFPGDDSVDPAPITEALAAGIPVIASDTLGHRELIEPDRTGLLYPVGNRGRLAKLLRRIYDSPQLRQQLAGAARECAPSSGDMQRAYAEFYRHIVAR